MPSTLTWLDTSEHDRRRALDVVDLFAVRDTVDELGLAGVRDAWADLLAPGTSTIQTRARYFFLIPWVYQRLEASGKVGPQNVQAVGRRWELNLVEVLMASGGDDSGLIGSQAGRSLKRLPSGVYWNGLGRLGIRLAEGSQAAFHRAFGTWERSPWHPHLPELPEGFPDGQDLALRRDEAEFLRDQVRVNGAGSLLSFLMDHAESFEGADFPWAHPLRDAMPDHLRGWMHHAECFAVRVHGAALLYNRMLAEELAGTDRADANELVETYGEALDRWSADVAELRSRAPEWNRLEFWDLTRQQAPRLPRDAQSFCDAWLDLLDGATDALVLRDDAGARDLIAAREFTLKRRRSRLRHREHLERWGGASGAARLNFRWGIASTLVNDVRDGLAAS